MIKGTNVSVVSKLAVANKRDIFQYVEDCKDEIGGYPYTIYIFVI